MNIVEAILLLDKEGFKVIPPETPKYPPYLHDLMGKTQEEREDWVHKFNDYKPKSEQKPSREWNVDDNEQAPTQLTHEYVTLEECERREREAFKWARMAYASSITQPFEGEYVCPTFEDYKQPIKS